MSYSPQEIKKHYLQLALTCAAFLATSAVIQATGGVDWASLHFAMLPDGQWWRLITGHLVHMDWQHYAMNMMGLSMCMVVFRDDLAAWHWPASFFLLSLFSSTGMYLAGVPYDRYMGFSDVLHGWILIGALGIAHKEPKFSIAIVVLFWLKIIEENHQLAFFTSYGVTGNVARESHIWGAVGGTLYALAFLPDLRQTLKLPFSRNKKGA